MMKPKEIRRQARMTLQGNYFFAVNLTISLTIFTLALTIVLQSTSLGESPLPLNQALFWILNLIVMILNSHPYNRTDPLPLFSLQKRTHSVQPWPFLYAFRNQPDTFILTYLFRYAVSLVWFAPALYCYLKLPFSIDITNMSCRSRSASDSYGGLCGSRLHPGSTGIHPLVPD